MALNTFSQWLKNSPIPRLEMRLLLQYVSGYSHAQLITHDNELMSDITIQKLTRLVEQRLQGVPIAYLLGTREFYGRSFVVNHHVLIPRPETEHLVDAVLRYLPEQGQVWDLGTGSGIIAITISLGRPDAHVIASDISEPALMVAKQNAERLGAQVKFMSGSWFDAYSLPKNNIFDVIVSNPPYIEQTDEHLKQGDLRFEPQSALTDFSDGLSCIRLLANNADNYLKNNGWLMVEHGYQQGDAVREIFSNAGFSSIETLLDLAGLDRITIGQMKS